MKLICTPILGQPLCYHVPSRRKGEPDYFVDLTQHEGNGHCTCGDFSCRVVANMKKPHELFTNETMCHHLRVAHKQFMSELLEEILPR